MTLAPINLDSSNTVSNQQDAPSAAGAVIQAIKNAATKTGVDFSYLLKKASQESGLDSTAKSSNSSATGLFQFTSQTWLQMVKDKGAQYGLGAQAAQITQDANGHLRVSDPVARQAILALRKDPQISAEMAGELDKQNAAVLQQNVGGKIGGTELYLAHFLGAGGASDFLSTLHSSPNTAAANVLPDAAASNQSIFYDKSGQPRSVADIYKSFAQKFNGSSDTQVASASPTTHHHHAGPSASSLYAAATSATSTAVSGGYTVASAQSLPSGYSSLFTPATAQASSLSALAGNANSDSTALGMSSASTLFNTMVLGQLQNNGLSGHGAYSALGALNASDHHRNSASLA